MIHKSASHMNVSIEERSCGWLFIPKILSEIQLELTQFNPSKAAILHLKFARTLINERFEDISIEKIETFRTIHGETEHTCLIKKWTLWDLNPRPHANPTMRSVRATPVPRAHTRYVPEWGIYYVSL